MRAGDVDEAGQRQVERLIAGRQAGHAGRRQADAVVAERAGEDLRLARPAAQLLVGADQLQRRLVRLRARVGEEHFVSRAGARAASLSASRIVGSVVVLKNDG